MSENKKSVRLHSVLIFGIIFAAIFLLHIPLLNLPYFGDEAGYYIPSALDLLQTGTLIPHSTPSNAHPPLVMAYLALAWKIAGYALWSTRTAMLLIAALSLLGLFRLAQRVANTEVAVASVICAALYPVFFMQSSLAHLDLAAAGMTFWGLLAYIENRRWKTAALFSFAVLIKETAILAPFALIGWEWFHLLFDAERSAKSAYVFFSRGLKTLLLLFPLLPLGAWYLYHHACTGYVLGNPEFFRYNVQMTLNPLRIMLALLARLWQMSGYMGLYILTLAAIFSKWRIPLSGVAQKQRTMTANAQPVMMSVMVAYWIAMSAIGGAVLARYMLPVVPLAIILSLTILQRRVRQWRIVAGIAALVFVLSWFVNPPYGFAFEDNLALHDYSILHRRAAKFLEARYPKARVLTAWPASGELTQPHLGYVKQPMRVQPVEDFSLQQLLVAKTKRSQYDVAMIFSTKYEPPHSWFKRWVSWQEWRTQFFGYHRDELPAAAALILGGQLVYEDSRKGQWVGVVVTK
jgi:hypothetical protein